MPYRLLFVLLLVFAQNPASAQDGERPRNVILMIADGFGPASATLARTFSGEPLALDGILRGAVRTASTTSRVTDSAASGTAYASGIQTYNGAIGVDSLKRPVGTLLEAAERRGMKTGLVVTSRLTHATPAAFAAHVPDRWDEEEIAAQMMGRGIDVAFGGGRTFFVPEAEGGARTDGRDLLEEARARGVAVLADRAAFDRAAESPVLGLFAADHLAFEIDRAATDQPSLAVMTRKALDLLDGSDEGFFLMVEGSRIDHAAHDNDPAGHVHDILAYDTAVRVALDFARADGRTLVVSVADHETGGLSLGRDGIYNWYPDTLRRVGASAERMQHLIAEGEDAEAVLREVAAVDDLTVEERATLGLPAGAGQIVGTRDDTRVSNTDIGRIVSRRALVGWTTTAHTGVDVGLYAFGPGSEPLHGVLANDAVGQIVADVLGLDLAPVTERLRSSGAPTPGE